MQVGGGACDSSDSGSTGGSGARPNGTDASSSDASMPTRDALASSADALEDAGTAAEAGLDAPSAGSYDGPVVDAACPTLPEAGTWQNVSPPGSHYTTTYSGIDSVVVRPDNPAVVFAGADSNGIFKSTDCGAHWTLASTGENASAMTSGRPWSMQIDPVTPDRMYVVQGYGAAGLWMSVNAGVDWKQILTPVVTSAFSAVNSVSLDPTDHMHLVVMAHQGQDSEAGACGTYTCIAESTDGGSTWAVRTIPIAWSEGSTVMVLNRTTWIHGLYRAVWYTQDQGATWQEVGLSNGASPSTDWSEDYVWQAPGGRYLLPANLQGGSGGVFQSQPNDVTSWSPIANSPQGQIMMATTSHIVLAGGSSASTASYWMASQSDTSTWSTFAGPSTSSIGGVAAGSIGGYANYMAYDGTHHVLYDATNATGLWQAIVE
jgi:photosystem II stability/assembly factor-like uncharacterized protein